MQLVIFGANGPTGQLLTAQALAAGHTVTAFTRRPAAFPIRHDNLQVMPDDVFAAAAVDRAVAGNNAVLSTLGVPYSRQPITVYSQGMTHIIAAMRQHGVRRLVCVTSSVTVPHPNSANGFIFEKILQPFMTNVVGRTLYADMRRMETLVMASDLDWTIVRPSGLFETPDVTAYRMAEGHIDSQFTSRADLAASMLYQLTSDDYVRKAVAVGTFAVQPNILELIMREGFGKRPAPVPAG